MALATRPSWQPWKAVITRYYGWIDESSLVLLASSTMEVGPSVWKVNIDGSGVTKLSDGWFAGFIY